MYTNYRPISVHNTKHYIELNRDRDLSGKCCLMAPASWADTKWPWHFCASPTRRGCAQSESPTHMHAKLAHCSSKRNRYDHLSLPPLVRFHLHPHSCPLHSCTMGYGVVHCTFLHCLPRMLCQHMLIMDSTHRRGCGRVFRVRNWDEKTPWGASVAVRVRVLRLVSSLWH